MSPGRRLRGQRVDDGVDGRRRAPPSGPSSRARRSRSRRSASGTFVRPSGASSTWSAASNARAYASWWSARHAVALRGSNADPERAARGAARGARAASRRPRSGGARSRRRRARRAARRAGPAGARTPSNARQVRAARRSTLAPKPSRARGDRRERVAHVVAPGDAQREAAAARRRPRRGRTPASRRGVAVPRGPPSHVRRHVAGVVALERVPGDPARAPRRDDRARARVVRVAHEEPASGTRAHEARGTPLRTRPRPGRCRCGRARRSSRWRRRPGSTPT